MEMITIVEAFEPSLSHIPESQFSALNPRWRRGTGQNHLEVNAATLEILDSHQSLNQFHLSPKGRFVRVVLVSVTLAGKEEFNHK